MKNAGVVLSTLMMTLGACAPKAPATAGTGEPSASSPVDSSTALYESHQHTDGVAPASSPEDETTLQFPFCERDMKTQFSEKTEGAAFRAIVLFRILPSGKTAEHCYLRVEGDIKWEERSLGNVGEWTYPAQFAGEQRERTVTFRLNGPPAANQPATDQPTPGTPASGTSAAPASSAAPSSSAAPATTAPAPSSAATSTTASPSKPAHSP